jgi:hypothetical protein
MFSGGGTYRTIYTDSDTFPSCVRSPYGGFGTGARGATRGLRSATECLNFERGLESLNLERSLPVPPLMADYAALAADAPVVVAGNHGQDELSFDDAFSVDGDDFDTVIWAASEEAPVRQMPVVVSSVSVDFALLGREDSGAEERGQDTPSTLSH